MEAYILQSASDNPPKLSGNYFVIDSFGKGSYQYFDAKNGKWDTNFTILAWLEKTDVYSTDKKYNQLAKMLDEYLVQMDWYNTNDSVDITKQWYDAVEKMENDIKQFLIDNTYSK